MEQLGLLALAVTVALLLGAALRHLLKHSTIPYTVALLFVGLLLGLVERGGLLDERSAPQYTAVIELVANLDPHLILFLFLPTLIFEASFAIETHLFRRSLPQIALLAVPGLLLSTLFTALWVQLLLPLDWGWAVAFLFAALISAIDPVAVAALLREVSVRRRLETLVEGESLLNDGTAIVLFTLFLGLLAQPELSLPPWAVAVEFVWVVALGLLVGLLLGWLSLAWLGRIFNDPLIEITLSIACAYLVFYLAEAGLQASGVVAVVTLGLLYAGSGRSRISPEVAEFLHRFWATMAYLANTLIFLLVGILIAQRASLGALEEWWVLPALYVGVLASRAAAVGLLLPVLRRSGIGLSADKVVVLIWGSLRGAIALALALALVQAAVVPGEIAEQVLFLCAGIVVLTTLINGGSMRYVFRWLRLDRLPPAKQVTVDRISRSIDGQVQQYAEHLRQHELLRAADWRVPRRCLIVPAPAGGASAAELRLAFRRRLLEVERRSYWRQFNAGTLSRQAVHLLVESVEAVLDREPVLHPRELFRRPQHRGPATVALSRIGLLAHWLGRWPPMQLSPLNYDIARGFLQAQDEALHHVAELAPSASERAIAMREIEANIAEVRALIARWRTQHPKQVRRLETRIATRLLLNHKRQLIEGLAASGALDEPEALRLIQQVERRMARLERRRPR